MDSVRNKDEYYYYYGFEKSLVRFDRTNMKYFLKFIDKMEEKEIAYDHRLVAETTGFGMKITKCEYETGVVEKLNGG